MKKMTKVFIIAAALLVLAAVVVAVVYVKNRGNDDITPDNGAKAHSVYCDGKFFKAENTDFMFEAGSTVRLVFSSPVKGLNYSFSSIGADNLETSRDADNGYIIQFKMPDKYVSVYYRVEEPFEGIDISLRENPSTGFLWEYEVSPQQTVVLAEDRYESDPYDGDEPIVGLGGTHYWRFAVVGKGKVEIKYYLRRGDEQIDEVTYKYACDGTTATLIEEYNS